jgi:hypothetical protein
LYNFILVFLRDFCGLKTLSKIPVIFKKLCNLLSCKRSLNVTCKSTFRQNYRTFLTHSSTSSALAWWHAWRRLVAKLETSNPDRTISPKAAVRSWKKCQAVKRFWPATNVFHPGWHRSDVHFSIRR